ncbi:zinc-finger-containing protein [Cupriavidus sp. SZY C1]|uniref:zinc-finger-containing protein n=1 Tax=Cupriavidus sp. SZY C1 TaxID=3055037 RepID=UPI0028B88510|nr:zinc-finger-containing protein [Cupriavidus sp. SZY C1]MDT6962949.1 zinc-finger-containing protein [Cupriavidus sp. SZY C1]
MTALTPWNPDHRAVRRVKAPLPAPTHCPWCQARVSIVKNSEIYGRPHGDWPWIFLCGNKECGAYIDMYPGTGIPRGTLADSATRQARGWAKQLFSGIWQSGHMTKADAVRWLAARLGIQEEECEIGRFDVPMCQRAVTACLELARKAA